MTELLSNYQALIGAFIGASSVLIANYITQSRTWNREDRLRNYEMRRDAYGQVLYASNRLSELLQDPEKNESYPADELDKALEELLQSVVPLRIVAPSKVAEQGYIVYVKAYTLVDPLSVSDFWKTWKSKEFELDRQRQIFELMNEVTTFVEVARSDLGLPPLLDSDRTPSGE